MLNFWYQALKSPLGVEIETDNPDLLIQKLYRARTDAADPDLAKLSIVRKPGEANKLWILKSKVEKL